MVIGAIFSYHLMNTIGVVNCMAFGSLMGSPFILCGLSPYLKDLSTADQLVDYFSEWQLKFLEIYLNIANGLSEGIMIPAFLKYLKDSCNYDCRGKIIGLFCIIFQLSNFGGYLIGKFLAA